MTTYRARYVFPVDRPPIENGEVGIESGFICAVGRFHGGSESIDLGDVAIIPGLLNAHTHLEFSGLEQPLGEPGMSLPWWIRAVLQHRAASTPSVKESRSEAFSSCDPTDIGIQESQRCGVSAIGNIVSGGRIDVASASALLQFLELRAIRKQDVEQRLAQAAVFIQQYGADLSPHAPYTVHQDLLRETIVLAAKHQRRVAMHIAESREELEFLQTSRGPFRDLLEERGWWEQGAIPRNARPLDYLEALVGVGRSLVIHGNYLDDEEIAYLAAHRERMSVVYCPRTHQFFRHEPYPLRKMLDCGVRVALGTDSRASNPDLDLRNEMRYVIEHHGLSPEQALRLGTIEGAAALRLSYARGAISNGKFADLAVVQLPARHAADPHELLFDPEARVVATVCRGHVVFSEHPALV
jgi:cytosine/adenosine deaminase-related metal-dependent hydrolase